MRGLKFRVWNTYEKKFVDTKNVCWGDYYLKTGNGHSGETGELLMDFDGNLRIATYPCGNGDNSADSVFTNLVNASYVIQQFTGLQDKNNKDIYEGDILKIYGDKDNCVRKDYCHVWYCDLSGSYVVSYNHQYSEVSEELSMVHYKYEVIGNVFQNLDLLP